MSPRKHQVLIYDTDPTSPAQDSLVQSLKPRLNPYYVVHPVSYASLQSDPWEDQCAALFVIDSDSETPQQVGIRVQQRIKRYLELGGRVVHSVTREGAVRDIFAVGDAFEAVSVQRSAERNLVLQLAPSSTLEPLGHNEETDIRAVKMTVPPSGILILTTLTAAELGKTSENTTAILRACNIEIPNGSRTEVQSEASVDDTASPPTRREAWTSVPPDLLKPSRPLPQIMLINPEIERDSLGWDIWTAKPLGTSQDSQSEERDRRLILEDLNDTFLIDDLAHDPSAVSQIMDTARSDAQTSTATEFSREKKILCPKTLEDALPAMPLFQADAYFEELVRLGRANGQRRRKGAAGKGEEWNIGDVVLYGEAVTSTQTMLDKNPKILRGLATPFLSLATFQLSGRGRGTNQWLSPPGCLQFSLLLTLPPQFPADKLVFIQYLAALAICDGLDPLGKLGVRIKWPNDIYAHAEGIGGTSVGQGEKGKAKLGGILVNSSFVDGQWRVVVGCGINVLNDLPTTSLAQLHEVKARRDALRQGGSASSGKADQVSMEKSLARILVSFEGFWATFLQDQGFKGLLDEYLGRWLHTDQKVTLTSTTPHQALVIKTITLDYGLLRCIPDKSAGSALPRSSMYDAGSEDRSYSPSSAGMQSLGIDRAQTGNFVDLQPDGNSFDLMSGLIKRKV